jgi:hypothetical protein
MMRRSKLGERTFSETQNRKIVCGNVFSCFKKKYEKKLEFHREAYYNKCKYEYFTF